MRKVVHWRVMPQGLCRRRFGLKGCVMGGIVRAAQTDGVAAIGLAQLALCQKLT